MRLYGAELIRWLIYFPRYGRIDFTTFSEPLMQIIIGDLEEFDEDMDKQDLVKLWRFGRTSTYFDIFLHRLNGYVRSMPTSERFRFVASILSAFDSPALTLRKIELCRGNASRHDITLQQFYELHGSELLHHVAKALIYHKISADLDLWTEIGVTAIQNGADPVTVVDRHTPLFNSLSAWPLRASMQWLSMTTISKRLQPWIHLLTSANVDLSTYFSRESAAWKSVGVYLDYQMLSVTEGTTRLRLLAVQYDALNQRCAFDVRHETLVPLQLLHYLPGSFTDKTLVPNTICWTPSNEEAEEGHWTAASSGRLVLVGKAMDLHGVFSLQEPAKSRTDLYRELVDSTQDDNGVSICVLDKSCRGRGSRKRSSSQPVSMAQGQYDYDTVHYSKYHKWLPRVHYCIGLSA